MNYNSTFTRDELRRLPADLCQEIYDVCAAQCQSIVSEGTGSASSCVASVLNPNVQHEQQHEHCDSHEFKA